MNNDITDLLAKYGAGPINYTVGTSQYTAAPPPPKQPSGIGAFMGNLGQSAIGVGKALGSAAYHSVIDPGVNMANKVINPLLTANTSINSINQQSAQLDQQVKQLQANRANMSKAQFGARMKALGSAYDQLSKDSGNIKGVSGIEQAKDFGAVAGQIATVASPLAAEGAGMLEGIPGAARAAKVVDETLAAGKAGYGLPGKLVRDALVTQPTVQAGAQVAQDVQNKNYVGAAGQVAVLAAPAASIKVLKAAAPVVRDLFAADRGFVNTLQFKDGTVQDVLGALQSAAAKGDKSAANKYQKLANQAKVAFDHMQAEGRTPAQIAAYQAAHANPTEGMTVEEFLKQNSDLATASKKFQNMAKRGLLAVTDSGKPVPATKYELVGAGKFDQGVKNDLIQRLSAAPTATDRQAIIAADSQAGKDYTRNANVLHAVQAAASHDDPAAMAAEIKGITGTRALSPVMPGAPETTAATAKKIAGADNGYIPIIKPKGSAGFNAASQIGDEILQAKRGVLAPVTEGLRKIGLSPEATDTAAVQRTIKTNFQNELQKANPQLAQSSDQIYQALFDEANNTRAVNDPRLLRARESILGGKATITNALEKLRLDDAGINIKDAAGQVRKALDTAYFKVPTELQGLGSKVTSAAIKYVPGERGLLKAQSYGRFALNPFFAGKVAMKSGYLGLLESNGGRVAGPVQSDVARYVAGKTVHGVTSDTAMGLAEDVLGGMQGANASSGMVGDIQRNIAGNIVQNILAKNKATMADLATNPALKAQVDHAAQVIYGYPKGGFLASNLAKSLNVAVFPARFEAKVLGATAQALAKQPPIVQGLVVNGAIKAQNWLQSDQGKQWQSNNAELYGAAKYFTPFDSISKVIGIVSGNKDGTTIKDLGAIGGLPFGFITEVLSHQGVNLGPLQSSPGYNPKTQQAYTEQIPQTAKARIYQGLSDIIGQMFSYPGAVLGLPSKSDAVKSAINFGTAGTITKDSKDFKTVGGGSSAPAKSTGVPIRGTAPGQKLFTAPDNTKPIRLSVPPGTIKPRSTRIKTVPKNLLIQR